MWHQTHSEKCFFFFFFSASYSRINPCFTAGKHVGVCHCYATSDTGRTTNTFTSVVYAITLLYKSIRQKKLGFVLFLTHPSRWNYRTWDKELLEKACDTLAEDLPLDHGAPGGKEVYRRTLAMRWVIWNKARNSFEELWEFELTKKPIIWYLIMKKKMKKIAHLFSFQLFPKILDHGSPKTSREGLGDDEVRSQSRLERDELLQARRVPCVSSLPIGKLSNVWQSSRGNGWNPDAAI